MKKFYIETLGCKVNQYESDGISQDLESRGWKKGNKKEKTDLFIVNTCAVTSKASMQSRQMIRKLIRENPDAKVIVTGCHAQTEPEQIRKIEAIDSIVCHKDKLRIADFLSEEFTEDRIPSFSEVDHTKSNTFKGFHQAVSGSMTRAYLKIQDGCNSFCSYCIVPYARGSSVSMNENDVLRNLYELNSRGFREVILTGIHTGLWGKDLKTKSSLSRLLKTINKKKPVSRIRLSSIEPGEITESLIELATPGNILCDHFHIPLQSGDDDILKKMQRPYRAAFFEETIQKIHEKLPFAGIGVDTLIGFPSESDEQFEKTYKLIKKLPISYLHVFPFSARKGTPAYHFDKKVDTRVIKERCTRMRKLGQKKQQAFIKKNMNRPLQGLVQNKADSKTGFYKAVTSNYLTLFLDKKPGVKGKILDLIPEQCDSSMNIKSRIVD